METTTRTHNHETLILWGWILAVAAWIMPILGIAGFAIGVVLISKDRPGHGVGQIVTALVLGWLGYMRWSGIYA